MRCLLFVALVVCGNAYAKMAQNETAGVSASRVAFAPQPITYQIPVNDVLTHFQELKKTRTLSDQETMIHHLTMVAATLKAEAITSVTKDATNIQLVRVNEAITKKIKEHPKWDLSLSADDLKAITPHLEIVKNTMGEKSYSWAWFLKQTGKTAEAKQLLVALFEERSAAVLKMGGTYNRQSPMGPVVEVHEALLPLSTDSEKTKIEKKMQDLKVHVSNLKDYTIMT